MFRAYRRFCGDLERMVALRPPRGSLAISVVLSALFYTQYSLISTILVNFSEFLVQRFLVRIDLRRVPKELYGPKSLGLVYLRPVG